MRVCAACSRENPDDRDFCECGEYLRWDPTGVVQAITPEVLQAAQEQAPPAAQPAPADPAQPEQPAPTPTLRQPAAPAPAPVPEPAEPDPAAITLRLPEGDHGDLGATLAVGVE